MTCPDHDHGIVVGWTDQLQSRRKMLRTVQLVEKMIQGDDRIVRSEQRQHHPHHQVLRCQQLYWIDCGLVGVRKFEVGPQLDEISRGQCC